MAELVRWTLDNGGEVLIEIPSDGPEISPVSRTGSLIDSASTSLSSALGNVRQAASDVLGQFRGMEVRPHTVEVEFGVRLTAEAGAIIAKTSAEGHLNVKLIWENGAWESAWPSRWPRTRPTRSQPSPCAT